MSAFSTIVIIYNPNSTGPSRSNAEQFADKLTAVLPATTKVTTVATSHAGHAEELTRQYDAKSGRTLVISSSGDGGYHEVVNGALADSDSIIVTGLLPSGNANDHYHALHQSDVVDRIASGKTRQIDIIEVSVSGPDPWQRYAHSYAGIGLTPYIGEKLTKADLNPLKEVWMVIKNLFVFSAVKITVDGQTRRYDSLIASIIPKMSKIMHLSDEASVTDGKFELTTKRSTSLVALLRFLLRSIIPIGKTPTQYKKHIFTTRRKTAMQLDGEVYHCAAGSQVTITCRKQKLACII